LEIIILLKIILLGIIEGVTEFLPVSSTGHLIVFGQFIKFDESFSKTFDIVIQLGAILAIVAIYKDKLLDILQNIKKEKSQKFVINLFFAFLPAALAGFLLHGYIKGYLFSPLTVALALILGGIVMIIIENIRHKGSVTNIDNVTYKTAFYIGLAQMLALVPGVSRSAATIMGGLLAGLNRKTAAEFSFFLAIPVMFCATFYDLIKEAGNIDASAILYILAGFVVAFITAFIVVKWFIKFISHNNFKPFAYYRIALGLIILLLLFKG
jgi:undecaprenyl-diphosphatase